MNESRRDRDRASQERIARGMAEAGREELGRRRGGAWDDPRASSDRDRWRDERARGAGGDRDRLREVYRAYGAEGYGEGSLGAPGGGYAPGGYYYHGDEQGPGHGREGYGRYAGGREPEPGGYGREQRRRPGAGHGGGSGGGGFGGQARGEGAGRGGYHEGSRSEERGLWDRASDEVASWFGDQDAERRRERDHRGRGPKGYRRSDERVREDVSDRLTEDPDVDASDIEVAVGGGEVTLSGTVDGREARRRAEDLAEGVSGVTHVRNNLRVRPAGRGGDWGHGGGTTAASGGTGTAAAAHSAAAGCAARAGRLGESVAYAAAEPGAAGAAGGAGLGERPKHPAEDQAEGHPS